MKTKEDIAKDIIAKHYETMNWDEGCIETLKENIIKGLKEYAQQQINLSLADVSCSVSEYCTECGKRSCGGNCF